MRRITRWFACAAFGLAALSTSTSALARPKIEWSRIDVPGGVEAAPRMKLLREALTEAARKANFGDAKTVSLSAKMVEFSVERRGEVLRVTCAVMGRVQGGASAKSRISFGGSAAARAELERSVVTTVANGLVARLAQIARSQAPSGG